MCPVIRHFFVSVPPFGTWSLWDDCNVTCGDGYQSRPRVCNIKPCQNEDLIETRDCKGTCTGKCNCHKYLVVVSARL